MAYVPNCQKPIIDILIIKIKRRDKMSNLIKPYEISVWDDIWSEKEEKFVERKVCTIGTNEMNA
jgi:hypothetical protein